MTSIEKNRNKAMAGPWVDEDRSHSDPLPPVNEFDDRPSTKDLIEEHSETIQTIRKGLEDDPLYDPVKHDDLWILRYVLSHESASDAATKAIAAAKKFLQYRKEKNLDETDIRGSPPGPDCPLESVRHYFDCIQDGSMTFSQPDPDRGTILSIHLAGLDQNKLAEISDEEWPFWYFLEWMFQVLDSVTRRTGRLTQGVRFIDLKGYQRSQNNKECIHRNAKNAQECQDYYPQMLASIYVLHAPYWGNMVFHLIKPLLPRRFVNKFDILSTPANKDEHQVKKILKHLSEDHLINHICV